MNRKDTHKALKSKIVKEEGGDGISFVLTKLSWDKDDAGYSLHVALSSHTSAGVQTADFLNWLGFELSRCPFVNSQKCYTRWVDKDFDLSAFAMAFSRTFDMVKDAQKRLERCGFFLKRPEGTVYFYGRRPDNRQRVSDMPGDGHEAVSVESMRGSEDQVLSYKFTWLKTAQNKGWVMHYRPKHPPLSSEIKSAFKFLELKRFSKCPEYDFEPCHWRSIIFKTGRDEFFDSNANIVNQWFDAHEQNFLPGILQLLTANAEIEKAGFGFLLPEQPVRQSSQGMEQKVERPEKARNGSDDREFDVVLSFAGAQRGQAKKLANLLKKAGFSVFYDRFHPEELWGKNLVDFFKEIYSERARFCVIFVSKEYKEREWTNHERQSAQARALKLKGEEYILPIQIDDIELEGMPQTLGYVSINVGIEKIGEILIKKLNQQ